MDKLVHRTNRKDYFTRQEQRYRLLLERLDVENVKGLRSLDFSKLSKRQIALILGHLSNEARQHTKLGFWAAREDVLDIDSQFHGTESDIAQTATPEQKTLFNEEFPKVSEALATLVLPGLLDRLDIHKAERPPFNIAEHREQQNTPENLLFRQSQEMVTFFGWLSHSEATIRQIDDALVILPENKAIAERKRYENHPVKEELDLHLFELNETTHLIQHDVENYNELWHQIYDAAKQFTPAHESEDSELIPSLFDGDFKPLDPLPFLSDTEVIRARAKDVKALQLGEKPVPETFATLICDVKIQYILNRPFAFGAVARAALEELLRYHHSHEVQDKTKDLASRIKFLKKKWEEAAATRIRVFGNNAVHHPKNIDKTMCSTDMANILKDLDSLAERFLPKRKTL